MRSIFSKGLPILSLLAFSFITVNAMAAPDILFKESNIKHPALTAGSAPRGIHEVLRTLQIKRPDLYKIVVYKMKDYYLLYLLSGKVWEVTKMRVDLDTSGKVLRVIDSYQSIDEEPETPNETTFVCPDTNVQFVAISAYPGVAAVNESIGIVSEAAKKKYKTVTILDKNADGTTYKNWLSCPNLKGFYSIGHGSPDGIMVGKGDFLSFGFFNNKEFINKYKETTVVINACQVYNYPFGTQIMYGNALYATEYADNPGPNAKVYMGGHTSLLMYSSERSSACFMAKAMDGAKMDYETLKACIGNENLHYQNFGLSHLGKYF